MEQQTTIIDCPIKRTVMQISAGFNYGDTITHQWLYKKLEIEFPEVGQKKDFEAPMFKYLSRLQALQDSLLRDHQMYLMNAKGYGYRIVEPSEQTGVAMSQFRKKIRKETLKAMDALTHINTHLLTDDQVKRNDEAIGKVAALSAFSQKRLDGISHEQH